MPQLQTLDDRPTKKVILPSSKPDDEAWVEVYTEPLADDIAFIQPFRDDLNQATAASIFRVIKDWNFTEKDGSKAVVSMETVRRLTITDVAKILEETGIDKRFEALSKLAPGKKKP